MDDKDGNGLQLENIGQFFQVLKLSIKNRPNLLWFVPLSKLQLIHIPFNFVGAFCVRYFKVIISAVF